MYQAKMEQKETMKKKFRSNKKIWVIIAVMGIIAFFSPVCLEAYLKIDYLKENIDVFASDGVNSYCNQIDSNHYGKFSNYTLIEGGDIEEINTVNYNITVINKFTFRDIPVYEYKYEGDEYYHTQGKSVKTKDGLSYILIEENMSLVDKRMLLAHEYCHYKFGDNCRTDLVFLGYDCNDEYCFLTVCKRC